MTRLLFSFLAVALSACGLSDIQLFDDEYLSDQYSVYSPSGTYAVGAEIDFEFHVAEGDTRTPAIEIIGDAIRIDETRDGFAHATAIEAGSGEIIYRIDGGEVRRYPFIVSDVEHIAVEHFTLDYLSGFVVEDGVFDPSSFSIAQDAPYGLSVRYEDAEGRVLDGAGLLSVEGGLVDEDAESDAVLFDTREAGEFRVILQAGEATTTITYDVVDAIASLTLTEEASGEDLIKIVANAVDAEGRRVYCRPTWRIDGQDYEHPELSPGFAIDLGFLVFGLGGELHVVDATLLNATASIESTFTYGQQ